MEEDDYGSDGWGEIDYHDLIAAADEVEKQATPSKAQLQQQAQSLWGDSSLIFMDDDFDDFDDDDMLSAAVPSIAISAPDPQKQQAQDGVCCQGLVSSTETLRAGRSPPKNEGGGDVQPEESRDSKPEESVVSKEPKADLQCVGQVDERVPIKFTIKNDVTTDRVKRRILDDDTDGDRTRKKVDYSGTIFPRFTRAYEKDLADAVSVAEFSLRLMEILTSVLREFLEASIASYPRQHRLEVAHDINRMVGHRKANASFQGWDFLALANFIIYHRNTLPRFIQKPHDIVERLRVLKTTMRWTVAHTSLQEEERKHPIELSLWAINTLFLIENLEVPMEYASKVMSLHQRLWSLPPPYASQTN